ncbi:MAG: DNA recombination/repair protein RecA [Candidatus Krumholzibacteria bacterium]|nr:DNA recombination/repair protein RecA [Candidatus Krumholzibacteria bacterium]MDH5268748.1 DNA recombination/repair protein RecA [Candidatus Krumholzibacteria bacterium]
MSVLSSAPLTHVLSRLGLHQGPAGTPTSREWTLDALAGRMVEISSAETSASLTAATRLILEAQERGEPAAWIASGSSCFYPPDVAASGVDLDALIVVRSGDTARTARAADHLLRSGGFGVLILDLCEDARLRMSVQSRLSGLANTHRSAVVCLTRKRADAPSIGSLVSIRGETSVARTEFDSFAWEINVIKDKRRGPGWRHAGACRGPDGLH